MMGFKLIYDLELTVVRLCRMVVIFTVLMSAKCNWNNLNMLFIIFVNTQDKCIFDQIFEYFFKLIKRKTKC